MTSSRLRRLAVPLALLLADAGGAGFALAQTRLPDPVAPAVIGRPLHQIRPERPAHAPRAGKLASERSAAAQAPARAAPVQKAAVVPAAPAPQAMVRPSAEPDTPLQRQAKMALDDREDTRVRTDDVGKGTHFARKALGPGAYFDDKDRAAVRKYFESHPASGLTPPWQVGLALPAGAPVGPVPKPVMSALPRLPPGHRYVQVGSDILLVAAGSGMVVDGISARAAR